MKLAPWISMVKVIHQPWPKVTQLQHFQTSFPSKPLDRLKLNFMWSLHGIWEQKFIQMIQLTGPMWLPCPYMVKTLNNLLFWNQKADDFESWYAALGTWVLLNLFKWWPRVDLHLFYGRVKFGPFCFCMGKSKIIDFSETIVFHDIKVGRFSQLNEYMNVQGQGHLLTLVQIIGI